MLRIPFEWLKERVTIRLSPEALAQTLTMAGFEVTGIESVDGEPVFSFEITPNRADCLSVIGLAREVAAITGAKLKLPAVQGSSLKVQGRPRTSNLEPRTSLVIRIEDRQGCRLYIGRRIDGIRIGPSPAWMQKRLVACGLRPINNVVDITNYVLLEYGQPLHAFDDDRLAERTLVVRRARAGEQLVTIDGQPRALSAQALVIADARQPVAVAGVMGGRDSAVNQTTTTILLESAWFDPVLIRRTVRGLGLASDSSYRFERGVDIHGVEAASRRAAELLVKLAGGRVVAVVQAGACGATQPRVTLRHARVNRLLGTELKPAAVARLLRALGCQVATGSGAWQVRAPSYRRDLRQDVDLIEEVARIGGYERLPEATPRGLLAVPNPDASHQDRERLRELCASLGLWEVMSWALVSPEEASRMTSAGGAAGATPVVNPLTRDHAMLRPSLMVGVLRALAHNAAQGCRDAALFELGAVFPREPSGMVRESWRLGIGLAGVWDQHWQGKQSAGLFRLKGIVEQIVERWTGAFPTADPCLLAWGETGRSVELRCADELIGHMAEVQAGLREGVKLDRPVWAAELDLAALSRHARREVRAIAPSPFPPVKRDLSILVDKQASFRALKELIGSVGQPLAARIDLIDRYADQPPVPAGKQSLTFSIEYRDPSRTLTADEVDAVHRQITDALARQFGAQLR
ncbi:MAG: phenylalanine--tRNA ligase subunit beta [Candidatus Omnitrophica bacterium]|nr:phenylalanine--tRNA ligase subunit beta [Candidatus Omnitrophota bacterium]